EPGPDGSSQPSASVTRETAFALVLRLPGAPPVSTYVNSECCLVFETIEALLGRTNLSTPVEEDKEHWEHQEEGQKPVVILGPDTPRDPRYIISSVQKFWSFSGRYITGFADPAYDSIAGNFAPRFAADGDAKLCRVLTTDLATVPLDLFQSAGATLCDQITGPQALGYIISPDAFAVRLANEGLISSALQQRLPRITEKSKLTPGDREALSMAGQVTAHYVQQHELGRHWPLDRLLALHLYARDTLALACRAFMNQPSAETARKVLHTLKLEPELVLTMGTDIGGFALALAARVDVFLALESADRQLYLKTLRNLDVADDVAWHLACNVREICDVAPREIVALFEFLSCCLSSEQVSEILVGAALGSTAKSRRIPYRLAECLRRYGTSLSSIMYLKKLQQEASPSLEDPSFLRSFSPLLRLGSRDYATDILGKALMQGIAAAEPFSLGFQEALASGDRDAALSAMSEMVALDTGEVMKWLDQMRSYSAVLEAMDLPLSAISSPAMERVFVRKKAAVIFSDMAVLKELKSGSILDVQQDADAVGLSFLGDHAALDAIIKKQSALGSVAAFELRGSTVHEVFAHASAMTATREPASQDGPLVSVIVSAFNPDIELMRLALNSITGQSHGNFEIFVVDDASEAPHSAEIAALCTQYESVHYHRMVRNSGPYAGRNYVLSRAKGDYFAIQDADDWSHPARFAQQVAALEADPLLQMVTTPHIRIDHNGRVQLEAGFQVLGDGPMTSMFRRAALVALGGFASTRSRGDVEMRERMRAYFGSHALTELAAPIALCLGDRQTLSQRVIDRSSHHLRAFRQHIDSQHLLRHARRDFGVGESLYRPLVPYDLRTSEVADTQ
ncbi:MAG: glycosyltransferase family 2 protein, partial [Pseudomonadota bacterium]